MKTHLRTFRAGICAAVLAAAGAKAADLLWIGGGGDWKAASHWSPAQVPGAGDHAIITNTGTYTVTVPANSTATAGSLTLGGASGTQTLSINRATLTLDGTGVVNANGVLELAVSQTILTGTGTLRVDGTLNWTSGTMSGTGVTTIASGGVLNLNGNATLTTRTLNNAGVVTWNAGNLTAGTGAVVNNQAGGTFDVTFDGRINLATAPATINNAGLFRKTAGTLTTVISPQFNNSGTLHVLAATLSLDGGGTHSGTLSNAAGATLNFGGGSHVLSAGSLVTGAGAVSVGGGATVLTASGTFDPAGATLSLTAGTATLTAGCDVTATTLNIGGGVLNFNSSGTVGTLNLAGGTLGGTSPVTVTGPLTLSGGTVTNALVNADGGLSISGNVTLNGGKLVNPGMAIWSAGNFNAANGAVISNLVGATFTTTFDGNINVSGATPLFVNAGTFSKTGGTAPLGTTSIDAQFINTGTVEVQTNTLRYALNQQTAGLTLLHGGNLAAQAQPLQFLGGSLMGTGLVTVANNQTVVNSASLSPGLPFGELDITGNYQQTASGVLNIDLGGDAPGTGFDLITVTAGGAGGVAALGGTLNVALTNGFSPIKGATFTFLTAVSRLGAFATFNYPSNGLGMEVTYDPTSVTLRVTNLKPVAANPIVAPAPVAYGTAFGFQFPANTFADPDNDPLSYTALGIPPGITFNGATRTFSGVPTQAGVFPVQVIANDNGSPNLKATNTFNLTVSPSILTIQADPQSNTYGAADPALTYNVSGLQFSDTPATVLTGILTRAAGGSVAGSPYPITQGTLAANSNYAINFTGNSLAITPAPLSVTAEAGTKSYGATDPAFTAAYSGFVNGETAGVLSGTLAFTRAPGENVCSYAITPTGLANPNYVLTFVPGTLTIARAPLSVNADAKTKIYGGADPAFAASYSGFVNGETAGALGGALAFKRTSGETVGNYPITPGGLTSPNYAITFVPGLLAISKAPLSVNADAKSKSYGAPDPAFTAAYSGFVNGEAADVLGGTLAFTRAPGENAGGYAITPASLASPNYAITFVPGLLTISKAPLSVNADAKTKSYGAAEPAFTYNVSGLQFSDTPATVLTGVLTRVAGETVAGSPYQITQGTVAANGNYSITFTADTLVITPAALAVTAETETKSYGAAEPALTYNVGGLQFSDTSVAVLTGVLTRAAGESVAGSPYPITQGTLAANGNYSINFTGNNLAITPAPLSVAAEAKTKLYGAAEPVFTATYSGLVNGETAGVLSGTLAFTRAPGENVGGYAITPAGLTNSNYALAFVPATLSITKAPLSVAADAKTKSYGAGDPALTYNVSGLQFSDTQATVLTGALTRVAGETVAGSPYPITQGTLAASGNYSINFASSALTVTPTGLSVTAEAKTKIYGAADPAFTATYLGFVNGETAGMLSGTLAFTRAPGENVGSYAITPAGLTSSNYALTFVPGTLSITAPAPVILSLNVTAAASVELTWSAVSNATYRVQYQSDLTVTNWTDLIGDVLATGSTASKTDILVATNRFYRVQVLP